MIEVERAYLAGLIDGEGTVTLTVPNRGQTPQPRISIANNSFEILEWVRSKVGCGSIVRKKSHKLSHHDSYAWQVNRAGRTMALLNEIKKFLILKRPQAELILNEYKKVTPRNGKYSPEMLARKMQLVAKMRKLNQR